MRCQMSAHANSIYRCIYLGHKNLFLYLSADWRLAPRCDNHPDRIGIIRTLTPD